MSIVIVCNTTKLHESISWLHEEHKSSADEFRMMAPVLTEFFQNAEQGKALFTHQSTQLYCFELSTFQAQFRLWLDSEQQRSPSQSDRIYRVGELIQDLFCSSWPIDHNLVVRECLDESELNQPNQQLISKS